MRTKSTNYFLRKAGVLLICLLAMVSCSKEDTPGVNVPKLSYPETTIDVDFNREGSITPDNLNWSGEVGTIQMMTPVSGVKVDTKTAVITWDKDLPLGESEIRIAAANSAGTKNSVIKLSHLLQGTFIGSIENENSDPIAFEFKEDGMLESTFSLLPLSGTWAMDYDVSRLTGNASGVLGGSLGSTIVHIEIDGEIIYRQSDLEIEGEQLPFVIGYLWEISNPGEKVLFQAFLEPTN